jgi:hypothetical protein
MSKAKLNINDIGWTDHVLGLLSDDEKIKGNPTTDGLRRIFEIALDCTVINSSSEVVQSPSPDNEKRATVVHCLTYVLNSKSIAVEIKTRSVNGAADVYWGNCDKIYRNHPVAVAETRAEGRALRRGLKLRKVVAAEEIADQIEDNPDMDSVTKITNNQVGFMDVLCKRLNVNPISLISHLKFEVQDFRNLTHTDAVTIIRQLSSFQQNLDSIPEEVMGYTEDWR